MDPSDFYATEHPCISEALAPKLISSVQSATPPRAITPEPSIREAIQAVPMPRPRCLPLLSPDMTITFLHYFELNMYYELQEWPMVLRLQEEGLMQARTYVGNGTSEQREIAAVVVYLYDDVRPMSMPSGMFSSLLIRTYIQLFQWSFLLHGPSKAQITQYLKDIPRGDIYILVLSFAAAQALSRNNPQDAEWWLEQLFSVTLEESAEADIVRIALAQCYWQREKVQEC